VLSFQPALDPFHAVFRALRLVDGLRDCLPVEWDKFRILDFYLSFPFRAVDFQFRQGQTSLRKIARGYEQMRPYGVLPDDHNLVGRMEPVQAVATQTLAGLRLLNPEAFRSGMVARGDMAVPEPLRTRVGEANQAQADLMHMLSDVCASNPLLGPDGIKRRSGLLEYRNDAL
jgi:hypothetical protein